MNQLLTVNGKEFEILKLLGKGKGGYSYLASRNGSQAVLKQLHHEPCDYYQFGNKLESELRDYQKLTEIGLRLPKLLDYDTAEERILKEYIEGPTIYDLVLQDRVTETYLAQMKEICARLYAAHTNIDYFPTNFIVRDELLYYVDYECNDYMEEWNFENWGIRLKAVSQSMPVLPARPAPSAFLPCCPPEQNTLCP